MATIIQVKEDSVECIQECLDKVLSHVRMAEHILTEIKEKFDKSE